MPNSGIVVVSNRLPVIVRSDDDGDLRVEPGTGGLVSALSPVLRKKKGTWVGWPGGTDALSAALQETLDETGRRMGLKLKPLSLTSDEVERYYHGFSSETLWPLFHDLTSNCRFEPSYWEAYARVNAKVARVTARAARDDDFIWVHDYHLMTTAKELRCLGIEHELGFFLHVPFPPPDIFGRLPWRREILEGLLDFDVVGFQTDHDVDNFLRCVHAFARDGRADRPRISRSRRYPALHSADPPVHRGVTVGSFPIGIDYGEFRRVAESEAVSRLASDLEKNFEGTKILLGVDRLDYTKGLPHKLHGYRRALQQYPELRRRVTLVQHVVPSRESVTGYRELRPEIERLASRINGEFGTCDWIPVRYFYQSLSREELCAFYRISDGLVVTSLKDGMNLVAKEYCASNIHENGVLILSEFAGAKSQLGGHALVVNVHDADAIGRAIRTAVVMSRAERRERMSRLRSVVEESDVFRWVHDFLEAAVGHAAREISRQPRGLAGAGFELGPGPSEL